MFSSSTGKYYISMDWFYGKVSYFSGNVSFVPLPGEISSKEEEHLWLAEKRL